MERSHEWRSYHLFYHADRNRLLMDLVLPAVSTLLDQEIIDRFFFIRYGLGGPHVRLRTRVCSGRENEALLLLSSMAEEHFARRPSTTPLSEEAIRQTNQALLAGDPQEEEDAVYPDNSLRVFPASFEVQRYGGPELLEHSLDFFAFSSVQSLLFLAERGEEPWARQLPQVFRLLARQAWGLAGDVEELLAFLEFPMPAWRAPMAAFLARGDEIFEQRPGFFVRLLAEEIEETAAPTPGTLAAFAAAARGLAWEIREADAAARRRIATSQMHMTANRLGLKNREEAYLSRLMWRAGCELLQAEGNSGDRLRGLLAARAEPPPGRTLRDLLSPAFAALTSAIPKASLVG
jgi:Lantibiotic biosynthesis dehydratase C-term